MTRTSPARRAALALACTSALCAAAASPARAEPADAAREAAARALFEEAAQRMAAGQAAAACPKLEDAVKLAPGALGARQLLGECYEKTGRLASAWSTYRKLAADAEAAHDAKGRDKEGARRAAALEPRLSRLTIAVSAATRALPGLELRRDGAPVTASEIGLAIPVDGGKHAIAAAAPGKVAWSGEVDVPVERGAVTATVPTLEDAPVAAPPAPAAPAPAAGSTPPVATKATAPAPVAAPDTPAPTGGAPTWAWVTGGLGLAAGAGAGVVAVLGVTSRCAAKNAAGECSDPAEADSVNAKRHTMFAVAGALGGVGAVLVGVGVYGVASAPAKRPAAALSPWIAPGMAGAALGGRF